MNVIWQKCGGLFCNLELVDPGTINGWGVYLIWQAPSRRVVYVGQGLIGRRVVDHQRDPHIIQHRGAGQLLITWAFVAMDQMNGIERYLADFFRPLEGERHPDAPPISVNLPA